MTFKRPPLFLISLQTTNSTRLNKQLCSIHKRQALCTHQFAPAFGEEVKRSRSHYPRRVKSRLSFMAAEVRQEFITCALSKKLKEADEVFL